MTCHTQSSETPPRQFLLGPVLVFFILISIKTFSLSQNIFGSYRDPNLVWLFFNDLTPIGLVIISLAIAAVVKTSLHFYALTFLGYFILIIYIVDLILITQVNLRLSLGDFLKYFSHALILLPLVKWYHLIIFILGAWISSIKVLFNQKSINRLFFLTFLMIFTSESAFYLAPAPTKKYASNLLPLLFKFEIGETEIDSHYSDKELSFYNSINDDFMHADLKIPNKVILLVVESLSSSDSYRASGLANSVPMLDNLALSGSLFPNGIANYPDSEGGLISLLGGIPPIPYEGSTRNLYLSFRSPQSPIKDLNIRGYRTEFATNANLKWIYKMPFLESLGFGQIHGPENSEFLRAQKRFTCNAPPDGALYKLTKDQILPRLQENYNKFFLVLATVSSHRPYLDPLGVSNTRDNVMRYVDNELSNFVGYLRDNRFFEDGTLIITGDHRRMEPITAAEFERYGESAVARIPLIIIGPGAQQGKIDKRIFQQSDLLKKYSDFLSEKPGNISNFPVFVDRYTRNQRYLPGELGKITFFTENQHENKEKLKAFPMRVAGNSLLWEKMPEEFKIPELNEMIEKQVHRQRAYFQLNFQSGRFSTRCGSMSEFLSPKASGQNGFLLDQGVVNNENSQVSTFIPSQDGVISLNPPPLKLNASANFRTTLKGLIKVEQEGEYRLGITSENPFCIFTFQAPPFDKNELGPFREILSVPITLKAGLNPIAISFWHKGTESVNARLQIRTKNENKWRTLMNTEVIAPN